MKGFNNSSISILNIEYQYCPSPVWPCVALIQRRWSSRRHLARSRSSRPRPRRSGTPSPYRWYREGCCLKIAKPSYFIYMIYVKESQYSRRGYLIVVYWWPDLCCSLLWSRWKLSLDWSLWWLEQTEARPVTRSARPRLSDLRWWDNLTSYQPLNSIEIFRYFIS